MNLKDVSVNYYKLLYKERSYKMIASLMQKYLIR